MTISTSYADIVYRETQSSGKSFSSKWNTTFIKVQKMGKKEKSLKRE
jgi:hypothetical protein